MTTHRSRTLGITLPEEWTLQGPLLSLAFSFCSMGSLEAHKRADTAAPSDILSTIVPLASEGTSIASSATAKLPPSLPDNPGLDGVLRLLRDPDQPNHRHKLFPKLLLLWSMPRFPYCSLPTLLLWPLPRFLSRSLSMLRKPLRAHQRPQPLLVLLILMQLRLQGELETKFVISWDPWVQG